MWLFVAVDSNYFGGWSFDFERNSRFGNQTSLWLAWRNFRLGASKKEHGVIRSQEEASQQRLLYFSTLTNSLVVASTVTPSSGEFSLWP
jgi:hypothetical protein